MEKFKIAGNSDYLEIEFEEIFGFPNKTCHWGGYDSKNRISLKSGNFSVNTNFFSSTGEISLFYESLKSCNEKLEGIVNYKNYEGNLEINANYDNQGHVIISGNYCENTDLDNSLKFEFLSDQTFIKSTLEELQVIVQKYGGMKGVKN